jgi:hypothetical protein
MPHDGECLLVRRQSRLPQTARAGEGRNSVGLRPARNTIPRPGQFPAVLNKAQWRGTY